MLAIQRKPVYNEVHMNLSLSMCACIYVFNSVCLCVCVCTFYNMQDYMDIYLTKESVYLLPNIVKQL